MREQHVIQNGYNTNTIVVLETEDLFVRVGEKDYEWENKKESLAKTKKKVDDIIIFDEDVKGKVKKIKIRRILFDKIAEKIKELDGIPGEPENPYA